VICEKAFFLCTRLYELTFEAGSKLTTIEDAAFSSCSGLKVISIPASVQSMGWGCLALCERLEKVSFSGDSQLAMLDQAVFHRCRKLVSLFIPSSVENVGLDCFHECDAMTALALCAPSNLRVFNDVPLCWSGLKEIPDSVECLCLGKDWGRSSECTLVFGVESRLARIKTPRYPRRSKCFLRVSSRSVKLFRSNLEFNSE
jgi:hypothetical protein